jgi:GTP-binding protein
VDFRIHGCVRFPLAQPRATIRPHLLQHSTFNPLTSVFEISAAHARQFPEPTLPEVVFLGRSNVGKSSLINTLTGKKQLAKVSNTPGKTRLVNFFRIDEVLRFVDLPGYGFAKVSHEERKAWDRLIMSYLQAERPFALVLVLIDSRHPLQESDAGMVRWFAANGFPLQIILTKVDKLKQGELARQKRVLTAALNECGHAGEPLLFSSVKGTGRRELMERVVDAAGRVEGVRLKVEG